MLRVKIKGIAPLIMHAPTLVDPLHKTTRAYKAITSKRKKTEADLLDMARIEWEAGLYHDEELGPYLPGATFFAAIREGAKVNKLGTAVKRCVLVPESRVQIKYKGPRDVQGLWDNGKFTKSAVCKLQKTASIMRYRPIFHDWSAEFTVIYNKEVLQKSDLEMAIENAGNLCGLGDWRPLHGRFQVESYEA